MSRLPYEARGVRCTGCAHLDLKAYPEHAKTGYGHCTAQPVTVVFVRIEQSRNCGLYGAANPADVAKRDAWASKNPLPAWQR